MGKSNWLRVSRQNPCPICGKPDNCEISIDGTVAWCGRVSEGSLRQNAGGQFLHRLVERRLAHFSHRRVRQQSSSDLTELARRLADVGGTARIELATRLGVSVKALAELGVGWHIEKQCWTFPERNANGTIIGISARYQDDQKRRHPGSRAGLTYVDGWDSGNGPILLVEGASDTAALLTIALNAVGRPSNAGGIELLLDLLVDLPSDRDIIVIGERDQKPNGHWPGKAGAIRTAQRLADGLNRPIAWSLPPDGAKDSRAWLQSTPEMPVDRLAALFVSGLETCAVEPPPRFTVPVDDRPEVPLSEWRKEMLRLRIKSLQSPGCYLDFSPTGSGKTHVDFLLIQYALQGAA